MMQKKSHTWKPPEALRHAVPKSGGFLHIGGETDTTNRYYAWTGTKAQFLKLSIDHGNYNLVSTGR